MIVKMCQSKVDGDSSSGFGLDSTRVLTPAQSSLLWRFQPDVFFQENSWRPFVQIGEWEFASMNW
ncbi:hypothetical protein ACP_3517 [Acidobacterium capsulatum ATCC 51196]|uniref:Uncharacterized protein n=1 Tax=Acidobacterium capsulatum (strain ATCC 51196 / DSM 11244 / BCRC 80197 / JCM 7670 / NBRC 15755 / NCIMB 13165 / 161) TaxID=240015 RepID=C1F7F4_ACIC5|nr:hypothetical protein ACP_3517 [Acidobacterium capsulatum ATCC 51196]